MDTYIFEKDIITPYTITLPNCYSNYTDIKDSVIFCHGSDLNVRISSTLISNNNLIIQFTGNETKYKKYTFEEMKISSVNRAFLNNVLPTLHPLIGDQSRITEKFYSELTNILFNKDSGLEELLKPFSGCDPFQSHVDFQKELSELDNYIKERYGVSRI